MVDAINHVTPKLGLTPTVVISKDGAPFAVSVGTVVEIGNGWYGLVGNAADRNVLGELIVHAEAVGADPADVRITVVEFDPFADVAVIRAETENVQTRLPAALVGGRIDASVGAMATDALTAAALAVDAVTEIQAGLATASTVAAIKAKTDNLPADPASEGTVNGVADLVVAFGP
jgi:hypothetical protein